MCHPKFMFKSKPQCDGFGGGFFGWWSGHEGRAFLSGISALIEWPPERVFSPFPPCEDTWDDSYPWTRKLALTRQDICLCLDLGFPSLKNCFKLPSPWYFVIAGGLRQDTMCMLHVVSLCLYLYLRACLLALSHGHSRFNSGSLF